MQRWYLDACSLINLYATRKLEELANDLGIRFVVMSKVYPGEAHYIFSRVGSERGELEAIDLSRAINNGSIKIDGELSTEELEVYVAYAALLDDGEAMTIAAAELRNCGIVTDDLRAWKVLQEHAPDVPRMTTLNLIKSWSERKSVDGVVIRDMFNDIRIRARFMPSPKEPDYVWLQTLLASLSE